MQMWSGGSAASAELLPGPVPSSVPIRPRHSAGGTLHPALVTIAREGGGVWGGRGSVEVQSEKLQRKEQSVFKQQGREPTPAYFHGKGLQDVSKCGKAGDSNLKIGLLITHSSPPPHLEAGTSILELKGHWMRITKVLFLLRRCFSWKILLRIKLRKQNQGFLEAPGVSV